MVSAWLNALSALDRRLHSQQLTLIQYRTLAFVHESKGTTLEKIQTFININDDETYSKFIIDEMFEKKYLRIDEEDEEQRRIILTEVGTMIIDEVYRLCQSRLAKPFFTKPDF